MTVAYFDVRAPVQLPLENLDDVANYLGLMRVPIAVDLLDRLDPQRRLRPLPLTELGDCERCAAEGLEENAVCMVYDYQAAAPVAACPTHRDLALERTL